MSLIQLTDVAETLAGLTDSQKQFMIDAAETQVANMIGFDLRQSGSRGAVLGKTESSGPLARVKVNEFHTPELDSRTLLLPVGPLTKMRRIERAGTKYLDFERDMSLAPWSVQWRDPNAIFSRGIELRLLYDVGWDVQTSTDPEAVFLPAELFNAVVVTASAISSAQSVAGAAGAPERKSEAIGDWRASYTTAADASGSSGFGNAKAIVEAMLFPWTKPRFV